MKLITRQTRANEAAERWNNQYRRYKAGFRKDVSEKLHALGKEPDPDLVDAITGNHSWTRLLTCEECDTDKEVVRFGNEDDYSFNVCKDCLKKALELFK